jgi:hypothetical protein
VLYSAAGKPQSATYNDGMTKAWTYNADGTYQIAVGNVPEQAYTSYAMLYSAAGKPQSATYNDGMTEVWTYEADGSYTLLVGSFPNSSVVGYENLYNPVGVLSARAVDYSNGAGALTLEGANETVTFGDGMLSIAFNGDVFDLSAHAVETFTATSSASDTFVVDPGVTGQTPWRVTIAGVSLSGATADLFDLSAAAFGAVDAAQAWSDLISAKHTQYSGGNAVISDVDGDTLTLKGVTSTILAASQAQFSFL